MIIQLFQCVHISINQLEQYYLQQDPIQMAQENYDWTKVTDRALKAAYPERAQSQIINSSPSKELALQRSESQRPISVNGSALRPALFPHLKKIEIKKQDHTLRNILCVVALLLFIIIAIDIKTDIERQWHKFQLEGKHCFQEYTENECDNPIDAMRAKCKELQICYSTNIEHKIKISAILGNLIGTAGKKVTSSAGLAGSIFLLAILCAILFFAYKSSKATMTLKKD